MSVELRCFGTWGVFDDRGGKVFDASPKSTPLLLAIQFSAPVGIRKKDLVQHLYREELVGRTDAVTAWTKADNAFRRLLASVKRQLERAGGPVPWLEGRRSGGLLIPTETRLPSDASRLLEQESIESLDEVPTGAFLPGVQHQVSAVWPLIEARVEDCRKQVDSRRCMLVHRYGETAFGAGNYEEARCAAQRLLELYPAMSDALDPKVSVRYAAEAYDWWAEALLANGSVERLSQLRQVIGPAVWAAMDTSVRERIDTAINGFAEPARDNGREVTDDLNLYHVESPLWRQVLRRLLKRP